MKFPSLRSVIEAVTKPALKALKCFYDHQTKEMFKRVTKQDEALRETQAMVAELTTKILELSGMIVEHRRQVAEIKDMMVSNSEYSEMKTQFINMEANANALDTKYLEIAHLAEHSGTALLDNIYTQELRSHALEAKIVELSAALLESKMNAYKERTAALGEFSKSLGEIQRLLGRVSRDLYIGPEDAHHD